ncbi:protein-export chaperone SecB [Methanococcus maripaludis]|uniref:Protein-export chaperone SecB n=1 Tax=Methanococcus maripaludis TaxID=39152 RepID=A0A8T3VWQ0_METMI|nr:protein-export chaperone SecB [Methanococcus maripaludis]MBG0768321.1 protein-export chaperone SecB [Methanococcus maripaludis]
MVELKKAALIFTDYTVNKIEYMNNNEFKSSDAVQLKTDFNSEFVPQSERGNFDIKLGVKIFENPKENNYPFYICAELTGHFEVMDSDVENLEQFAKINATSILFPYLRALISTVTANANVPALILPPANIIKMLEENKKE